MEVIVIGELYMHMLSRCIDAAAPATEATDRFVKRSLAQKPTWVKSSLTHNVIEKMALGPQLRAEVRASLVSDSEKAWQFCTRADATCEDLDVLSDALSEGATLQLAGMARSPEVIEFGFRRLFAGDRSWDPVAGNFNAPDELIVKAIVKYPELAEMYANGGRSEYPSQVLKAVPDPVRLSFLLIASGKYYRSYHFPGQFDQDNKMIGESALNAICETLALDNPKSYQDDLTLVGVVAALVTNGRHQTAPACMYYVAEALRASGVGAKTFRNLDDWFQQSGYQPVSSSTNNKELAQQVASASGQHLDKLVAVVKDRLDKPNSDNPSVHTKILKAVWDNPSAQVGESDTPTGLLFGRLDLECYRVALETLISEQQDPKRAAQLFDAITSNSNRSAPVWCYQALAVPPAQLAAVYASRRVPYPKMSSGIPSWSRHGRASVNRLPDTAINSLFEATGSVEVLAQADFMRLYDVSSSKLVQALDVLLGGDENAWVVFETFSDQHEGTVGELAELCRLIAASGGADSEFKSNSS